jgi:ribose transport system permease protein
MILQGRRPELAQVIQGTLIVLVVMVGGLAIRQKAKAAMSERIAVGGSLGDNPRSSLTFVFVALFVATDIVNRVQEGEAFLTPTQVSTTFLYAAVLGLIAAGQTLVMLTGGVDLSVATTATAGAFMVSRFGTHGSATAILIALGVGLAIGLVNGIGIAIFRVNALIMTLGVSTITLGLLTIQAQKQFTSLVPDFVVTLGSERFLTYIPYDLLVWAPIAALIILGCATAGSADDLRVGDNPVASRLGGVRVWQVLLSSTRCAALLRRSPGSCSSGSTTRPTSDRRAVPAPVGRGGRDRRHVDLRRLGGYAARSSAR